LLAGGRRFFRNIVEVRSVFAVVRFLLVLACPAVAHSAWQKPRRFLSLPLIALVLFGWLAPGQAAWAQTVTTCAPATTKGADGPVDFGAYCWIDFTGLNLTAAKTGSGQGFQVNLRGGAYLTFNLKITPGNTAGNNMYAVAVPSWSGAAFGNSAFNNIPGKPILYQDTNNQNAPQDTVALSNLILHANGSTELPFVFVAADGESSNAGETLSFTTTGANWSLVSAPGESNPARNMPTLSPPTIVGSSTGTQTVDIAGTDAGGDGEGSYVFTTDNSPGTVTATMLGNGLQGVLFGVKYHTIGLSLVKTHTGVFKAGGTGAYTINVANTVVYPEVNPPTEPQPVRVVDTLPTGLTYVSASGTGWSCSAVGQVVTCDATSLQDLTTSKTFPPITINVSIAGNAPSTITNNAEVTDPTTSTLVFNVCEVAANGVCPNSAVSTTGDPTAILHSNLSTSTKSVVDLNGGDAQPGDVLEYTITLNETSGIAAGNVSVADDMPLHVGSLTVVSSPAGSTNTSTTGGGANGAGRLAIGGITVPASGSATIVYRVTLSAGTTAGTTIDNTATIDNPDPNGTGGTAVAPTVTVSQSAAPVSGKVLYVYDSLALSRTKQTGGGTAGYISRSNTGEDWDIVLPGSVTLAGNSTVSIQLLVKCSRNTSGSQTCRTNDDAFWTAELRNGTTNAVIATNTGSNPSFKYNGYTVSTLNLTVVSGGATVPAGNTLRLRIINPSSNDNRYLWVEQYSGGTRSTATLANSTVIKVESVKEYGDATCSGPELTAPYQAGSTVYLCAVVSDPFGSGDINTSPGGTTPSIAIANASGAGQTTANMSEVPALTTTTTKTFVYAYTVPSATASLGSWSAKVTAWEGTEHEVFHSLTGNFTVAAPFPVLSTSTKTVMDLNGGDAERGDVLEYTITLKESAGSVANNVSIADDMSARVGSLTVVSKPAGSIDTSTTTGGANNTGKLAISGITVPANGTATVVYQVTIAAAAPNASTIDNIAVITNPGGSNASAVAPQVTVTVPAPVANGDKYLYLRNDSGITSQLRRARPTNDGTAVAIANGNAFVDWEMYPVVTTDRTLALPGTITGNIVMATAGSNLGTSRTVWVGLYTNAGTQLGATAVVTVNNATPADKAISFSISSPPTLNPGQSLYLRIQNRSGTNGNNIAVYQRYAAIPGAPQDPYSYLTFNTTTVIKIDAADVYAQPASAGNAQRAAYIANDAVYVRATVSDPFGSDDISSVPVTITDPSGATVATGTMTPLADANLLDGSRSYEFIFIVPGNAPWGGWTAKITAKEGVEDKVQDVRNVGFVIQGGVSLGKSWGSGAKAGDTVSLTIGGAITNAAGTSTAGGGTTAATAVASGGTTLTLAEAFTSGSAGNYTISLACTRTKDGGTVTVSGTGLSRTIAMPSDSGVACAWSNSKTVALTVVKLSTTVSDPVNGTTNPKAIPGAIVEYQIIVTNPAANPVDSNTIFIADQVPTHMDLRVADIGASGSGPVQYVDGSPASGMTYTFTALGNTGDDIAFSNDGGATWTYTPAIDGNGTDPAVTNVRINPKGALNADSAQFTIKLRMRIE
jgi:fimbrial isopeptide formation D2 family protein/uncharacterized repeat protein (TIGR01451 family)